MSAGMLSSALASTSAFITMPGPPPAGVSSTVPCLSMACARMSMASSDHRPALSARPARLTPSGPGNISGKIVSTVARHIAGVLRHARQHDDDVLRGDIDFRHDRIGERQQQRLAALRGGDFDQVAGAEIMQRGDGAERDAFRRDGGKPDQVGVVPGVVFVDRRQPLARHEQIDVHQLLRGDRGRRRRQCARRNDLSPARIVSISKRRLPSSVSSGP